MSANSNSVGFIKRTIDLCIAIPLLLTSLPVLVLFGTLIVIRSPGPILLRQRREGWGGEIFIMYKMRTMHPEADRILRDHLKENAEARNEWSHYLRLKDDPRLVPIVGRVMRKFSVDEFPQLWNVIVGNMSLVGPRPYMLDHLSQLRPKYRRIRTSVRPGLTGLWQVSGRSETDVDRQQALDLLYVRHRSVLLDLWILIRTIPEVIRGRGAY